VLKKELVRAPAAWVTYFALNLKKAPFTDKSVRLAFSQALDRDALVQQVLNGVGKPFRSWIPPDLPGYDASAVVPEYDPKAAVQTLIDAGYGTPDKSRVDCSKLGVVKLTYGNTPRNLTLFQFLADNLTRVFACPILLDPIDPGAYPQLIKDQRTAPQTYLLSWQQEYSHPQDWLFLETCAGVYATRIGYCNKDFDTALSTANQELDLQTSLAKYKDAQHILINDSAGVPLWDDENAFLIKPYVHGPWESHGTGDNSWPGQFGPIFTYTVQ
jgi:ABC-type oligopeptide transport system substrate-binding subunit